MFDSSDKSGTTGYAMFCKMDMARLNAGEGGVVVHDKSRAYEGYTLFTPMYQNIAWLIDMNGRVVHNWQMKNPPGVYGKLLDNGNLMWMDRGPEANEDLEAGASAMIEVDWDGNEVWRYNDNGLNHDFTCLSNGNIMVMRFVELPEDIGKKVIKKKVTVSLSSSSSSYNKIWSNNIQEISRDGKVIWEWNHWEHFDPEKDPECPLSNRNDYGYTNSLDVFPNGDILISIRHLNTIARISRKTGEVIWRWGPEQLLGHQHCVSVLDNGNIMVFDNGLHRYPPNFTDERFRKVGEAEFSRIVEVNPENGEIVWEYSDPTGNFYTPICGSAERLPNGNTLICESIKGIFFEVTPEKEVVWKYMQPFAVPRPNWFGWTISFLVFQIRRYGLDFNGFKGKDLNPDKFELTWKKTKKNKINDSKKIQDRLAKAGY